MSVDRDAIRARAEAATPGPWCTGRWPRLQVGEGVYDVAGSPAVWHHYDTGSPLWDGEDDEDSRVETDTVFIVHARTDVPALLDALDAAEARIAVLEAALRFYDDPETWKYLGSQPAVMYDNGKKAREALGDQP